MRTGLAKSIFGESNSRSVREVSTSKNAGVVMTADRSPKTISRNLRKWSQQPDSNRRPDDYKSTALPTELCWRILEGGTFRAGHHTRSRFVLAKKFPIFVANDRKIRLGKHPAFQGEGLFGSVVALWPEQAASPTELSQSSWVAGQAVACIRSRKTAASRQYRSLGNTGSWTSRFRTASTRECGRFTSSRSSTA